MHHECEVAAAAGALGSIDANTGDDLIGWDTGVGAEIEARKHSLKALEAIALSNPDPHQHTSGRQELIENILNELI